MVGVEGETLIEEVVHTLPSGRTLIWGHVTTLILELRGHHFYS